MRAFPVLFSQHRPHLALVLAPALALLFALSLICASPSALFAQQEPAPAPDLPMTPPAGPAQDLEVRLDSVRSQLANIALSIQERRQHLDDLRRVMAEAQTASERAEMEMEIEELERLIQASRSTFESVATGGVDSSIFRDQPDQPFDWQQELFEIIEPFLDQLKQFTETPRNIERINRELTQDQSKLNVVNRALANITNVTAGVQDDELITRLQALEKSWLQRKSDLELEINLQQLQLQELREEQRTFWDMLRQGMLSFVQGRGLILIMAVVVTAGVWFLLQTLPKVVRRKEDDAVVLKRKPHAKLLTVGYQAICVLLALSAMLLVLYVSGDWLLLGLAMIILVLVALGSRTYLPKFMTEVRMLLDMGPVREGERILLNGIPWEVKNLNMYSTLHNPDLQGGVLRVPLGDLASKISRPDDPEEPWFPTRKDDFVMLSDGTYGQVLLQTPEVVQIKHVGSVRTFSTGSFLGASPRNLTRNGFGFAVTFGIDYQHQAICLEEVPAIFETAVTDTLKVSFNDGLESVLVDFKEAGASSLDYLIYVMMNGNAAGSYWAVGRIIQQSCVRVCNERGWIIPFTQLTVHQGDGFEALRTARS
jgi:predicted  nucleic acid-binding Zn-ribbon protein